MKPIVIGRGIVPGFVATVVLSAMMLMKQSMGLMPGLDPIGMITSMAGASSPAVGWIGHLVIGTIFWGIGFAIVSLSAWPALVARCDLRHGGVAGHDDRDDVDRRCGP